MPAVTRNSGRTNKHKGQNKAANGDDVDPTDMTQDELLELVSNYKEKTAKLEKDLATSKSPTLLLKENKEVKRKVISTTKDQLWRQVKFIGNDEETNECARLVFKLGGFAQNGVFEPHQKESFVATYGKLVGKAIGDKRSYAQSEMKKSATNWMDDHNGELPTVEEILACATRTVEKEDVFLFYVDKLLPNVVGHHQWGPNTRHYMTISDAKTKDPNPKKLITVSTEAFTVLVYENCRDKWFNMYQYVKANPDVKKKKWRVTKEEKQDEEVAKEAAKYEAKYTDQNKGQQEYGGWTSTGLKRFNELQHLVGAAFKTTNQRKKAHEMEKKALDSLRFKNAITMETHQDEQKMKRKRSRNPDGTEGGAVDKVAKTFQLTDYDD